MSRLSIITWLVLAIVVLIFGGEDRTAFWFCLLFSQMHLCTRNIVNCVSGFKKNENQN